MFFKVICHVFKKHMRCHHARFGYCDAPASPTLKSIRNIHSKPGETTNDQNVYPINFLGNKNENGASKPTLCKRVRGKTSQEEHRAEGKK
jgi:hypothetical protein